MTNVEYLAVMRKKVMEKAFANVIRKTHYKEREENKVIFFAIYFDAAKWASQHAATRSVRAYFEYNWSATIVRETWQDLHEHLQASSVTQGPEIIPITRFLRFTLA
jgi:hypothetical protein